MNMTTTHIDHDPEHGIDPFARASSDADFKHFEGDANMEIDNEAPDPREAALTAMLLTPVDPVTEMFRSIDYMVDRGHLRASARPHYKLFYDEFKAGKMSLEQVAATGMLDRESVVSRFGVPDEEIDEAYRVRVRAAIEFTNKVEAAGKTSTKMAAEMRAVCEDFLSGKSEFSSELSMIVESSCDGAWA